jgi:The GLUG motif
MKGLCLSLAAVLLASSANAALVISDKATENVTCNAGTCAATARSAVLNVTDFANMIAVSPVTVQSGGEAQDIVFAVPFSWASSNGLTLDAFRSVAFEKHLSDSGVGSLAVITNDGGVDGALSFGIDGHVTFAGRSNKLTINGDRYMLAASIAELAANIASHPKGFHALAEPYDAGADGAYSHEPISTAFGGTFEGLGNPISNFYIYDTAGTGAGLFAELRRSGVIRNVRLVNVTAFSEIAGFQLLGPLVEYNEGLVSQCQATGAVRSDFNVIIGGLVGESDGTIERSFANVSVSGAEKAQAGGLVGNSGGKLFDDYATGAVIAGDQSSVGGFVGYYVGTKIERSYSTGTVSGGQASQVGGFVGSNIDIGPVVSSYWDITTSDTGQGVGSGDDAGVTGLTTDQMQSGRPSGFSPKVWRENPKINNGLPYLLANVPLK